jgi:uncharacterized protein YqhQ
MISSIKSKEGSLAFGGQALIEGIMMRSGSKMVFCVRAPTGDIITQSYEVNSISKKYLALKLPFVRGILMLFETLYYGTRGIFFSANTVLDEEEEFSFKEYLLVIVIVLLMSTFFAVVPFILTTYLNLTGLLFNFVEDFVRLTFFIIYLYVISLWKDFKRVLQYHGAEHKAINAYEAGINLEVNLVDKLPRFNPRCGTSFLFIVVLISIILYSLLPSMEYSLRLSSRILLIPVIASISYELLKLSDKYRESSMMKILTLPGMIFQKLTTKEPDKDMIEVAIRAIDEVKKLNS